MEGYLCITQKKKLTEERFLKKSEMSNYSYITKGISSLIIIVFLSFLSGIIWFKLQSRPVIRNGNQIVTLSIQKGESLDQIAKKLKEKKIIRSVPAFKIQVALSGLSRSLQAGQYRLSPELPLKEIIMRLTKGTSDRWITLLEGWRKEQYAQEIINELSENNPEYNFDPDKFLKISTEHEGKLYPDTYAIPLDASSEEILAQLLENYQNRTSKLSNNTTLSNQEAIVLGSLIEREAANDKERSVVGGILYKRLQNDWPLQVDASVQYIIANRECKVLTCNWWPNNITREDINIDSPYNTYNQPGLPPSPIANPSISSIKAAYDPTATPYWFYLHDTSGQIHYAKTIQEHNENVQLYLR